MPAIAVTLDQIKGLDPCSDAWRRIEPLLSGRKRITAAAARKAGCTFGDIIWAASAIAYTDKDVERLLRLFMADCAARVLHIYEKDCPADDRPRKAIEASRAFARGEIDDAAWAAARDAARAAARDAAWDAARDAARAAARDAAWAAARDAARDAAWAAARDAAWAAARAAARAAAWAAAWAAARDAARDAEEQWQFDRLIARLSAKEPEDWPLPEQQAVKAA